LRHDVYADAGFKKSHPSNLDVTVADLQSRFLAAFTVEDGREIQVGGIRMVYRDRLSSYFEFIAKLLGSTRGVKTDKRFARLPTEEAFSLTLKHSDTVEFSRTCVATAYRGSKLAYGLIDGIAALAREGGVRYALGSCDVHIASLYESFGYSRIEGAPVQVFPEVGIESCSLLGDLEELPVRHRQIVANFRQKLRRDGYISHCATPACFWARDYIQTHKVQYYCPLNRHGGGGYDKGQVHYDSKTPDGTICYHT
jgi:hypothetical protein